MVPPLEYIALAFAFIFTVRPLPPEDLPPPDFGMQGVHAVLFFLISCAIAEKQLWHWRVWLKTAIFAFFCYAIYTRQVLM